MIASVHEAAKVSAFNCTVAPHKVSVHCDSLAAVGVIQVLSVMKARRVARHFNSHHKQKRRPKAALSWQRMPVQLAVQTT
jgi:hypothetical protein